MNVRNLQPGEEWPTGCEMGYTCGMVYRDWCWIAESEGQTVAALLTIPAHGVLLLLRIAANEDAPPSAIRALLNTAFEQASQRGLIGYLTWTEPCKLEGQQLLGIVRRAGGTQDITPVLFAYGTIADALGEVN